MNARCANCGMKIRCLESEWYQVTKNTVWTHEFTGLVTCLATTKAEPARGCK